MPQTLHERPSTSPLLDEVIARRAHIRAIAAALVDGPRMGRRFHVPAGVPLQPSPRRRRRGPRARPTQVETRRRPMVRRVVAGCFLVAQVGVLATLLTAPAFRVHTVEVSGENMLGRDAVLAAARVPHSSLFTVDGEAIESRLSRVPWIRSATVTTQLPSTVRIAVTEWQPDMVWRRGSASTLVAANGALLPVGQRNVSPRPLPLLLDYRPGASQPLLQGLPDLLAAAAQRWPGVFGCSVDAFVLSNSNVLSAWCSSGWQAVFGALDSSEALAAVPQQLAVLAALKGHVDFVHPAFGYVDVENPTAPTVGGHPGVPLALRGDIAGGALVSLPPATTGADPAAAAAGVPTPTPTPVPTPRPTPTPVAFSLAPPSPTGRG